MGAENLAPTGIRSPDRPARSESLYRLSYPSQPLCACEKSITTDTQIKCHVWQMESEDAWDLWFAKHGCTIGNNAGILIGH